MNSIRITRTLLVVAILLLLAPACSGDTQTTDNIVISGELHDGYRVLRVQAETKNNHLTVYRGDYVKFQLQGFPDSADLTIPDLSVTSSLPATLSEAPYFKMKKTGRYPFTLGSAAGEIEVVEFLRPQYTEVSAQEANQLIQNLQPLILDVRTRPEYLQGHIDQAVLIPLQELQKRKTEVSQYRDEPVLIYCATGNRSTVASKILIDAGFKRIYNLRHGIAGWVREGLPVNLPARNNQ
jgi:rhodanese-related sulfurtransferase